MTTAVSDDYGPMIEALRDAFGVTFEHCDTGGGCTALIGEFEGDTAVYITDSAESPQGQEAFISDMANRADLGEDTVGYAVGVYRDEHCDQVAYGDYPTATVTDLPRIVREQLGSAAASVGTDTVQD